MRVRVACGWVLVTLVALAAFPDYVGADRPGERPAIVHVSASAAVEPAGRMTIDGRRTDTDRPPLGFALRLDLRVVDWLRVGGGLLFVSTRMADVRLPNFELFASTRLGFPLERGRVRFFTFVRVDLGYSTMFRSFNSEGTPGLVLGTSAGTEIVVGPRFGLMVEAGLRYRRNTVFRELLLPNERFQRLAFVVLVGPTLPF